MRQITDELLKNNVIRKSTSMHSPPAFLVSKADKSKYRLVCNLKKINQLISYEAHPLPTINSAFEFLSKAKFFTSLDMYNAFFQIPLDSQSRQYTAFCTPYGLFEFNTVPQGLKIGSQALTRVMDEILGDFKFKFVFNFLDD